MREVVRPVEVEERAPVGVEARPPVRIEVAHGELAQHIAVRVPEPCDATTFYAYVLGEQTPVRWLPALRPLHYAAIRADGAPAATATAGHLARVLLVPVGPDYTAEEIKHVVLGITKAADYLGVRWATDPHRASTCPPRQVVVYSSS